MIRDEPLGWTEIPLNQIQYGSDYTSATEKWFHLSTLRRTGKKYTVNAKQKRDNDPVTVKQCLINFGDRLT